MNVSIRAEENTIIDAKYQIRGCKASTVMASVQIELAIGKNLYDSLTFTNENVLNALYRLPEKKIYRSVVYVTALRKITQDYFLRNVFSNCKKKPKMEK